MLRLVVTEGEADEAENEHFEQVEAPMVRVSAPEITEEMMVKLSFESAHLEVPAQGHLVLFLDGHEIRRWMEPCGTVLLAELPAGPHNFGVAIAIPEGEIVSQAATVAFALEAVAPMPAALEPKVFMHPSTLPPDLLKFDIKIEDFDLSAGHAVVLLNERPAAVIREAQSCIVLKDLPVGRNCMQVRRIAVAALPPPPIAVRRGSRGDGLAPPAAAPLCQSQRTVINRCGSSIATAKCSPRVARPCSTCRTFSLHRSRRRLRRSTSTRPPHLATMC